MTTAKDNVRAMPTTALTTTGGADMLEKLVVQGDLSRLSSAQRLTYYQQLCESVGLNPYSRPFEYLQLSGKLVLYARKDATDQLRKRDRVSVTITSRDRVDDVYVVVARATTPDGRADESIGAVPLVDGRSGKPLTGEALANALMKAEAKAKRRVTLSICGLGMLDETEVASIPDARPVQGESPAPPSVSVVSAADPWLRAIAEARTLDELRGRVADGIRGASLDRPARDRAIAAYRAREAELKAAPEPPPAEAEVVTAEAEVPA